MAIKSKSFKRLIIKGLCVFLSLLCVGTAVISALNVADFALRAGYFYGVDSFRQAAKGAVYDPRISSDFLREIGFSYYAIKRNLITYRNGAVFENSASEKYLESMREKRIQELYEGYIDESQKMAEAYNAAERLRRKAYEPTTFRQTEQITDANTQAMTSPTVSVYELSEYEASYYDDAYGYLTIENFTDNPGYIIDEDGFVSINDKYYRSRAEQNVGNSDYDLERYENEYKYLKSYLAQLKSLEYFVVNNATGEFFTNSGYKSSADFVKAYEKDTWFVSSDDNFDTATAGYIFENLSRGTAQGNGSGYSYLADASDIIQTKEGIIIPPSAYTYQFFTLVRYGYFHYQHTPSYKYLIGPTELFQPDQFTVYLSFDYARADSSDPFSGVYSRYIESVGKLEKSFTAFLVSAALLLILLCAFLLLSGKGHKGEPVALRRQDKIPGEIHLIVSAAAVVGAFFLAFWLAVNIATYYEWRVLITLGCVALCVSGYSVLLNLVASFNRRRLNKTLLKNLLVLLPFRLVAKVYRRLAQNSTHLKDGVRRHYKFFVPFYVVITVVCVLLLVSDSPLVFLGLIGIVLVNAAMLVIIYSYAKSLDKIRDTVSQAQQGNFDVEFDCASMPAPMTKLAHEIEDMRCGMKQAIDTAVHDQRTKTELITNVSHDLKTPLTSIITYTDLIRRSGIEDETVRGYADVLAEKSLRLKRLIEDLTEAVKASTGSVDLQLTDVDLYELAMQAVGENEDALENKHIDVRFTPVTSRPVVRADGQKTYRVFENIISNITKYALEDTVAYVMVGIQDGCGTAMFKNIASEQLNIEPDRLMERFVRGDDSRSGEGSGLGLSIARDLCTLQGGGFDIYIDGDMFTAKVTLPLTPDIEKYRDTDVAQEMNGEE